MANYSGPDKLVGTLLGTVGPQILYWENVKSLDVQRMFNSIVLSIQREEQEYIGFGNESWQDVTVQADLFIYQYRPKTISDEQALEQELEAIHTIMNQYNNSSQTDSVVGSPVVWVKVMSEERQDEVRGAILYTIEFQVRIHLTTPNGIAAGSALNEQLGLVITTQPSPVGVSLGGVVSAVGVMSGLTQLTLNFLSGLPNPSAGGVWTAMDFSVVKSLDVQRTGDVVVVHAPNVSGQVIGLGVGQVSGQYTQQQVSMYSLRLTFYASTESDIIAASDWVATNSVRYFLNAPFGNGQTILAKMESFGQILNERGIWQRDVTLLIEAIVGP